MMNFSKKREKTWDFTAQLNKESWGRVEAGLTWEWGAPVFSAPLQHLRNASRWQSAFEFPIPVPLGTQPYLPLQPHHQIQSLPYLNKVLTISLIDFPPTWEEWIAKSDPWSLRFGGGNEVLTAWGAFPCVTQSYWSSREPQWLVRRRCNSLHMIIVEWPCFQGPDYPSTYLSIYLSV